MTAIIERLLLDHARFRSVLNQATRVLEDARQGNDSAWDRLYCIVDYLNEYPSRIHHPVEDVVFKSMLNAELSDADRQRVVENANQHESLHRETEALFNAFDDPDADFDDVLTTYIAHQLEHMHNEETVMFPMAHRVFSEADWAALEEQYELMHDDLFDATESRFGALYECLGVDPDASVRRRGAGAVARYLFAT